MAGNLEQWYFSVPPVTRIYVTATVALTLLVYAEIVAFWQLYLNFEAIWKHGEVWRLVTNLFFFEYFGLGFLFHLFFLYRHSRHLEESSYRGRMHDFILLWLFGAVSLTLLDFALYCARQVVPWMPGQLNFLAQSLSGVIVYVWSRRNQHARMSLFGLFTFNAPYLPWVVVAFGYFLGSSPMNDLMGIAVGHMYFFLEDVYPAITGRRLLQPASAALKRLVDALRVGEDPNNPVDPADVAFNDPFAGAADPDEDGDEGHEDGEEPAQPPGRQLKARVRHNPDTDVCFILA